MVEDVQRAGAAGRWTRRGLVAVMLVGAGAAAFAVVALAGGSAHPRRAAALNPMTVVHVARRDLIATDTESGTIGHARTRTVFDRLAGTLTWLPAVGRVIAPGRALFEVDGRPVILMNGTVPAYRKLRPAMTPGADVLALNRNLVALGFDAGAIVVDDTWQPATTIGVKLLQEQLGERTTGRLALGQIVFLPGAQVVDAIDGTLGASSAGGPASAPVLQTSSTRVIVTVALSASTQSEARVGASVPVQLPSGRTVQGRVVAVDPAAQGPGAGSDAGAAANGATVDVTISLRGVRSSVGLDQADVSVTFTQAAARHVLSVPVTALIATAGGGYAVQQAGPPQALLPVRTGLFAAGDVQVSGADMPPGLAVTVSQG